MNLNNNSYKIFVDFDGTITTKDVGEAMFLKFSNGDSSKEWIIDWLDGKINSAELWILLCSTVHNISTSDFEDFIDTIRIDPGFKNFVSFCQREGYEIRILSDGFDAYINRILVREGLGHLKVYSNQLEFSNNGKIIPHFPFTDEECARCANCKRNHVLNFSGEDDYTFYIGDGNTDLCASQFCDFIFAKNSLLRHCEINRITYFPYTTFEDVTKKMIELRDKKRLRKRHQAELKRKEIYIQG